MVQLPDVEGGIEHDDEDDGSRIAEAGYLRRGVASRDYGYGAERTFPAQRRGEEIVPGGVHGT